ncbi:hypothetical protein FRZ06_14270 [Anoxybacterium hadale]|uniref:Uncharacterized protein n=1 Tax=Anoxybacterium hadale TaxID=3408580 RepID=A0ACD1ADP3_9FIRM|nr:hypothetical protein FRZ06_14270 [Clostridiales bacterium]
MRKIIASILTAVLLISANLSPVSAASLQIYGETKMNLWDLYLTENNKATPDAISTATIDAVSQATYNPYDNKPVNIETGVDLGLIADSKILKAYGIQNEMVDRILSIWETGYRIPVLGTNGTETNPLTKNVVRYTADDKTTYDFSYEEAVNAASDQEKFSWKEFAEQSSKEDSTVPPYKVKFLLDNGDFGKRTLISSKTGMEPPLLSIDREFSDHEENLGRMMKLNFENDSDWANAVYGIKVNESGLLQGNMELGSYSDHNGDTSFLKGQDAPDKTQLLIRLSQKFRLGENKLTFMAHGYQDAEFTINLDGNQERYPWIVTFRGVNADNNDDPLTADSIVKQGDVLRVDAVGSGFSGKYDGLYIDGKPLPKENISTAIHTAYYEYLNSGKTLQVYTDQLTEGIHELHLTKRGYNDLMYFFTVNAQGKKTVPELTAVGEKIQVGGTTTEGGSVKGTPVVLKAKDGSELKDWFDGIRKILYINDSTGTVNQISLPSSIAYDDAGKTVTIDGGSMAYWNAAGSHTIVIRSNDYQELRIQVKRVTAMPAAASVVYREADGAVVVSADSSYISSDNIQTVVINGISFPGSTFELIKSYPTYAMTIPSEYFDAGTTVPIKILTKNYSDLTATISIPETHVKRKAAPEAAVTENRILNSGGTILLNFPDDPDWRAAIQTVVLRNSSNSDTNMTSKMTAEPGKLTLGPTSYQTVGNYTLMITASGYQPLKLPVEIVAPVPGVVSYELQPDGSVSVVVAGSSNSYISKVSVFLDGQAVAADQITKGTTSFALSASCFPETRAYHLLITADGYADTILNLVTDVAEPPSLRVEGQYDTEKKSITVFFDEDASWREAVTGAELLRSSGTATTVSVADKSKSGEITLSISGYLYQDNYTLKLSAPGYRKAMLTVKILSVPPSGVAYELLSADGELETNVQLANSGYAGALTKIKMGNQTLTRGTDFTVTTSGYNYFATIPGGLPQAETEATLYADNYANKTILFTDKAQPPTASLPSEIGKEAVLTVTSGDSEWALAVTGITIGSSVTSGTTFGKDKLTVNEGTLTIPADKMKNAYLSSGTEKVIKVTADGYRTLVFRNLTIYDKLSSVYPQTTEWIDGNLHINLTDTSTSYSYYSVNKVYLDGTNITSSVQTPKSSNAYRLVIPKDQFEELTGTVSIRITGSTSSALPELVISVDLP